MQPGDFVADAGFDRDTMPTDGGFMRARTALFLAAAAALLAACAGPTGGMARAVPPAYATGEGTLRAPGPASAEAAAPSGQEHHMTRQDQSHVH